MTLLEAIERVDRLDVRGKAISLMGANGERIADANKDQMQEGLDSFGNVIGYYNSEEYATMKQQMGSTAPYGVVDLLYKGDFQRGMKTIFSGEQYDITSSDWKTNKLTAKYGKDIFGLTDESKEGVGDIIIGYLTRYITEVTGFEFKT